MFDKTKLLYFDLQAQADSNGMDSGMGLGNMTWIGTYEEEPVISPWSFLHSLRWCWLQKQDSFIIDKIINLPE